MLAAALAPRAVSALTGASTAAIPFFAASSWSLSLVAGSTVDISRKSVPGLAWAKAPSGPKIVSSTSLEAGSMVAMMPH